ncbi:MAG TPA: hypothetical protein ENK16_08630, partial [Chromatiales bacterium]|nr:hypothetical protein [Chromatiales bacterium]
MTACHDTRLHRAGFLILALLLAVALLRPAPAANPDQPEPERYAVEVVVFEHLDQSRNTAEQPLLAALTDDLRQPAAPEPAEADGTGAAAGVVLNPDDSSQSPNEAGPGTRLRDTGPQPLPSEQYQMNKVVERLQRLDAYRPILHVGWIQPALPRDEAQPIQIALQPATSLSGELLLYKERFLHLAVRMQLGQALSGENRTGIDTAAMTPAVIDESRRLRGDKPQYFDNPRFGVLARVWKLPPEEPATPNPP